MKYTIVGIKKDIYLGPYCPHSVTYCCLKDFSEDDDVKYDCCGCDIVYIHAKKDWNLYPGDIVEFKFEEEHLQKGTVQLIVSDVELIETMNGER